MYRLVNEAADYQLLPPYDPQVKAVKEQCRPNFHVTEEGDKAQAELQDVADHQASRILDDDSIMDLLHRDNVTDLEFRAKTGYDSSGLHQFFKQEGALLGCDRTIMGTWFSALQMVGMVDGQERVYFTNTLYNAEEACVPLRLRYIQKEDEECIQEEKEWLESQTRSLVPKVINGIRVRHRIWRSMVDQKVVSLENHVRHTRTCPVCLKTHKFWESCTLDVDYEFLNLNIFEQLQISVTHFGINGWVHCINLGIREPFSEKSGKYNISAADRPAAKEREADVQVPEFQFSHYSLID